MFSCCRLLHILYFHFIASLCTPFSSSSIPPYVPLSLVSLFTRHFLVPHVPFSLFTHCTCFLPLCCSYHSQFHPFLSFFFLAFLSYLTRPAPLHILILTSYQFSYCLPFDISTFFLNISFWPPTCIHHSTLPPSLLTSPDLLSFDLGLIPLQISFSFLPVFFHLSTPSTAFYPSFFLHKSLFIFPPRALCLHGMTYKE